MQWETRNDYLGNGVAESDVQMLVDLALRRWSYYKAAAADPELAVGEERDAINSEIARLRRDIPMAEHGLAETLLPYDAAFYRKFAANSSYDPTPFLSQLDIPLFYAFGEADANIPTRQSVAVLEALIEQEKDITIAVYPDVGHSLATWKGLLSVGFVPGYLDTLASWTAEQVKSE